MLSATTTRVRSGSQRTIEVTTATAVWCHSGLPPVPIRWVLIRDPDGRFEPQALLSTDLDVTAQPIGEWFVLRWLLNVTFHEVRTHLGVETQRQWSELAIRRTTPALLGLFSLVTLHAHRQAAQTPTPVRRAAWYPKTLPTFADALALVRRELWSHEGFALSARDPDVVKLSRKFVEHLTETLCYAA